MLKYVTMAHKKSTKLPSKKDIRIRIDPDIEFALQNIVLKYGLRNPKEAIGLLLESHSLLDFGDTEKPAETLDLQLKELQVCVLTLADTVDGLTEFMAEEHRSRINASVAQIRSLRTALKEAQV